MSFHNSGAEYKMTVNWTDELSVCDPHVDEDHKTLINHFNKFEWATEGEIDLESLNHIFIDLKKHAVEHFLREEVLMVTIDYPDFDKHKQSHIDIMSRLDMMQANIHSADSEGADGGKIVGDISIFLNDWLTKHIIGEDHLYKPYVVKYRTQENKGNRASDVSSSDRRDDDTSPGDRRGGADVSSSDRRGGADVSSSDRRGGDASPGDRRGGDASPGDRRGTTKDRGGFITAWRVVFMLVGIIIAGGAYWLYGDKENLPSPTAEATKSTDSVKAPTLPGTATTGLEWVAKSKCDKFPKIKWWNDASHMNTARYVAIKHSGDWKPYVKKWSNQLKKLEKIRSNGSAAIAPGGNRLDGKDLDLYISKVSKRVDVIKCLAAEAAVAAVR